MWEAYKRELVEKEAQTENFLEKFYSKHDPDLKKLKSLGTQIGEEEKRGEVGGTFRRRSAGGVKSVYHTAVMVSIVL